MKLFKNTIRRKKWSRKETLLLLERLAMYSEAGLLLIDSLRLARVGAHKKRVADITHIQSDIEAGGRLSASLTKRIGLSQTLAGLIGQGERTGNLAQTLNMAHSTLERQDELIKKCISAMMYPLIIGLCATVLTLGLVRGVMPQIIPLLTSMNATLPLLTRITIAVSNGVTSYGLYILIGVSILGVLCMYSYRRYIHVRQVFHWTIFSVPIVGKLVYAYSIAVFLRSCGMLLSSGALLTSAYKHSSEVITFFPARADVSSSGSLIEKGKPLSAVLSSPRIPSHVGSLVVAGESSGMLGESLTRAALITERDIDTLLKRITALIEPIMMVGMGGIVGGIALSIMLPIYDISKVLQHTH